MQNRKINSLEQILGDLVLYIYPGYLAKEYLWKKDIKSLNKDKLQKYYMVLSSISQYHKKIQRYPVYFADFYPSKKTIKQHEALDQHIISYLEDLDALRNKINIFLGVLKNDLKRRVANKREIEKALTWLVRQVNKAFDDVMKIRGPSHHRGMRFVDPDLTDSFLAEFTLQKANPLLNRLKPEFIERVKTKDTCAFVKTKNKWISLSRRHNVEISGLIDEVFGRIKGWLYDLLDIRPIKDVIELAPSSHNS